MADEHNESNKNLTFYSFLNTVFWVYIELGSNSKISCLHFRTNCVEFEIYGGSECCLASASQSSIF